jgi:hypothetical protein
MVKEIMLAEVISNFGTNAKILKALRSLLEQARALLVNIVLEVVGDKLNIFIRLEHEQKLDPKVNLFFVSMLEL